MDTVPITRDYLVRQREAFLLLVDGIERILEISPRTAELRKATRNPPPQSYPEMIYNRHRKEEENSRREGQVTTGVDQLSDFA